MTKTILSLLFAALFSSACATMDVAQTGNSNFSLKLKTTQGDTFSTDQFKGKKYLFVSFWATWCEPCKSELLQLKSIYEKYKDKIEFVGVAIDGEESIDKVKAFAVENNFPFPILVDPEGNTVSSIIPGGDTVPYSVLVGKDGTIISKHGGYEPGDERIFIKEFDQLINN